MADGPIISQGVLDAFTAASDDKKRAALGKMSIEAKQALLGAIKSDPRRQRPGFASVATPTMPDAPLAARVVHQTAGLIEVGRQAKNLASGLATAIGNTSRPADYVKPGTKEYDERKKEVGGELSEAAQHPVDTTVRIAKQVGGKVVDAVEKPFHDARGESEDHPGYDPSWESQVEMFGSSIMGGDVDTARDAFSKGDFVQGQAALWTVPGILAAVSRLAGTSEVSAKATGKTAAKQAERLASIQGATKTSIDRVAVAQDVQPLLKQYMSESNITDKELHPHSSSKGPFPGRKGMPWRDTSVRLPDEPGHATGRYITNVRQGARSVLDAANGAVDISNRPFEKVVGTYAKDSPFVKNASGKYVRLQQQIADALNEEAKNFDNPADKTKAGALRVQAQTILNAQNIEDLQAIKVRANKVIKSVLTPGQQATASVESAIAWRLTADAIREHMYPVLEKMSGVNLRDFGAREASAMRFRDGVYRHYYQTVDGAQASQAAQGYLEMVPHSPTHYGVASKTLSIIKRTPAGEMNHQFAEGVGELGKGAKPETVTVQNGPRGVTVEPYKPGTVTRRRYKRTYATARVASGQTQNQ